MTGRLRRPALAPVGGLAIADGGCDQSEPKATTDAVAAGAIAPPGDARTSPAEEEGVEEPGVQSTLDEEGSRRAGVGGKFTDDIDAMKERRVNQPGEPAPQDAHALGRLRARVEVVVAQVEEPGGHRGRWCRERESRERQKKKQLRQTGEARPGSGRGALVAARTR